MRARRTAPGNCSDSAAGYRVRRPCFHTVSVDRGDCGLPHPGLPVIKIRGDSSGEAQVLARTDHQQAPGHRAGCRPGDTVEESCRKAAINVQTYYRWRSRYGGMTIAEAKEAKRLREENTRLKKVVADQALDIQILKGGALRKLVSPERRRKCVDHVRAIFKVSERRACRVLGQSRRTQRYVPKLDPEQDNLVAKDQDAGTVIPALWLQAHHRPA